MISTKPLLATLLTMAVLSVPGQFELKGQPLWPRPAPAPPLSQRQLLDQLQLQLYWLENATRTVNMFATGADKMLWEHYEGLRVAFGALKARLTPQQLERGANDIAELEAGLSIIGEAFPNFQEDISRGRNGMVAFRTLCQVLRDSTKFWGQHLNEVARRLQIGGFNRPGSQ